ncbi:PIN domain-containing protein [Ollibium composti]|uniref:PIN domain-containing protein n=1 Tax=Ollibium composti TaxID=2675109 RepID=A0ABY2Q4N6_9HYPH|nr:PIN domain-containing protein [Mesorhizobium composti]THF56072.1 PIN domain-containing protein [Mesorhizobium composti]
MRVGEVFIDTNILLYIHDRDGAAKGEQALAWLSLLTDRQLARTNLQVLNEVAHVFLRKKWFTSAEEALSILDRLSVFGDRPLTRAEIDRARRLHLRYGYSWWDCLLLASGLELGCTHFLSEDLQDGQIIDDRDGKSLTILSPFAHSPEQFFSSL